ncbi:G-TYPE LECTIN S-RECEPTOR-LIKE SERINE/THREONINE-PROTEIN KINASE SD2-5, partial [Salix viminalis]
MEAEGIVSSRRTETNFSLGRFQLRFLDDGNLVLNSMNLPTKVAYDAYYTSGTYDASNSSNSGYPLIFNESGYMYILRRNGLREDLTKTALPTTDFYHRATLNFDGVFTQYSYPKTSSSNRSWSPVWSEPENICKFNSIWGSGACGYNSICSLSVDRRPNCNCPQEFSLLDQNDKHGSCIPNSEISCKDNGQNSSEELYDFVELRYVDYPSADAEHLQPQNEEQCRKACLNDCLCGAVIFLGKDCWKKKLPLSNGKLDSGFNGKTFIKFKKGYLPPGNPGLQIPETKTGRDIKFITGIVLLVSSVFVNFILISTFCFRSSFIHRNKVANVRGENNVQSNLRSFTYKELTEATEGFKDELGRGAFGGVYKGTIKTGFTDFIAVKKLDGVVEHGEKEFKTEVNVI